MTYISYTCRPPTSQNSSNIQEYKKLHLILMAGQEVAPAPVSEALTTGTHLTIENASFKRAARSANCDTFYKKMCTQCKFLSSSSFDQVLQSMKYEMDLYVKPKTIICCSILFLPKHYMGRGQNLNFSLNDS